MADITKELVYKDFDIRFKAHPVTGSLVIRKNAESIKQAVKNLILTKFYERPYRPSFGSGVPTALFELITPQTIAVLKKSIEDAIRSFEPRAQLIDVVIGAYDELNAINITIFFRPINGRSVVQTTLTLERAR
jgi:phage baseplate assembly protein W